MLVSLSSMPEAGKCALNDCLQTRPLVTVMLWFLWLSPSCLRKKRRFFLSFLASRIYCSSRSKEIKFCNNTSATQKFLTLLMHFLRLFLKKKKSQVASVELTNCIGYTDSVVFNSHFDINARYTGSIPYSAIFVIEVHLLACHQKLNL